MRRTLAAAGVVVLVLLGTAGPAQAAQPFAEFASPTPNQRIFGSTVRLDVTVRMPGDGTLRGDATVSWFSPENRPVPAASTHATGNNGSVHIVIPDRVFPWNGTYRVDVAATGRDSVVDQTDEPGGGSQQFAIDASPAPPGGVQTAVNSKREVAVAWNGNGEPDLAGYEVQRQLGSAAWEHVTLTGKTTTSVLDKETSQTGGTYRYRVVAFRSSAEAGKLNPSAPSSTSTARVPSPPVTTTTTTNPATTTTVPDRDGGEDGDDAGEEERSDGGSSGTRTGTGSSGGSSGSSGKSGSSGGSGGSTATTLTSSGKVDLSGFSALLEQARQAGQSPPPGSGDEEEVDGGFDDKLPFSGRSRSGSGSDDADAGDGDDLAILDEGLSDDGSERAQSLAFLAGGLLATVLVMHLLWVRSEVRRAELEALPPEPVATRPRRRRPQVAAVDDAAFP